MNTVREAAIEVVMAKDKFGALSMPAPLAALIEKLRDALSSEYMDRALTKSMTPVDGEGK